MKCRSPQVLCKIILIVYPEGNWGGSYSKQRRFGSLTAVMFSGVFNCYCWSFCVGGLWKFVRVYLNSYFYCCCLCLILLSQSFYWIFFKIEFWFVKRTHSQYLYASSEEPVLCWIYPLKIYFPSNLIWHFFVPILLWTRCPL